MKLTRRIYTIFNKLGVINRCSHFLFLAVMVCVFGGGNMASAAGSVPKPNWRFGITAPYDPAGYDLASLGVGAYLDWQASGNAVLPAGVDYIRVLRVRDDSYSSLLKDLSGLVPSYKGSVWLVGNEPDRTIYQDGLTAETYADRYFTIATQIRALDPTAKIGFGSIVQPTPLRIRYIEKAYNHLIQNAGGKSKASALIDIWAVHAFILNEELNGWGAGIPPGFATDHADAFVIQDFADTHSVKLLAQHIYSFRQWMAKQGEQGKPLWITEYGSLLPPIDPPGGPNYVNVSDQETIDFMVDSFTFFLQARNSMIGLPSDENRLVQRWFWYSLNDYRYSFGGSIFDPGNEKRITSVGEAFKGYLVYPLDYSCFLPVVAR